MTPRAVVLLLPLLSAAPAAAASYRVTPAAPAQSRTFALSYTGSGHDATTYRSTPPNPGDHADRNRVEDSSRQRWSLRFGARVTIGDCAQGACSGLSGPAAATGATSIVGHIHHVHVDGLYKADDQAERCTVRSQTGRGDAQQAAITMRYDGSRGAVVVSAQNPLATTLLGLPGGCPGRGDSFDLLLDNYFTPGFSFAAGYGPDRWFRSAAVAIPVSTLHAASRVTIPLGDVAVNRPPRHCAVAHRYEHCTTRGAWRGTLTLTAVG